MGKGIMTIDLSLVEKAFLLPDGMHIITVGMHDRFRGDELYMLVEHEDIPEKEPGALLPRVELTYHRQENGVVELEKWTTDHD